MTLFPVTGVLLAGGQSRRMGFPKGKLVFRDRTLAERALHILESTCAEVWVSSSHSDYNDLTPYILTDAFNNAGPLGGIYSSLKVASYPQVFFIPLDLPFISDSHVRYIIKAAEGVKIPVIPVHADGKLEPLCGVYPTSILSTVLELLVNKQFKVLDLLQITGFKALPVENFPEYHEQLFFNVNTPTDAQKLNEL
ncbi:MAG: molybdenum cofactor guanylyltransferase [Bacteroidales bacterium]